MGIIKRTFNHLDKKSLVMLYKSLVRPILEYGCSIWFPTLKGDINEIEKVQRRATKIIPDLSQKSYPERLKALNLPTLAYRRKRADMLQTFRILKGIDNVDPANFFEVDNSKTRGHSLKIKKPRANTNIKLYSFSHRCINNWNSLPEEVIQSETLNGFKSGLENHWKLLDIKYDPDG